VRRRHKEAAASGEEGQRPEPKQAAQPPAPPEKVIVFSQWTRMLDLVERALRQNRIRFARLDGSMSVPSREGAIRTFTVSRSAVFIQSPAPCHQSCVMQT
jgi:SNF2 family DNA or RNA helicase